MKEDEDEEEWASSFDNPPFLNNNNEPSSMTTTRPLLWWFTKDVLRRTTEGRTQLDEEDDEEGTEEPEAERRNTNRGIKVRVRGGSLVEERDREEPMQERLYPKACVPTYTCFAFSLCVLWRVREAILWWLSLWKRGDGNYEGDARTQLPLSTLRKPPPSLLLERWLLKGLFILLVGGRRHGNH